MKQLHPFRVARPSTLEGQLMAAGNEELPEGESMNRAARRLGISASTLASASVVTALAPSASAATAASAVTVKATSGMILLLAKSALIGLCIGGVVVATGAMFVRSRSAETPGTPAIRQVAKGPASPVQLQQNAPKLAPLTSSSRNVEVARSHLSRASNDVQGPVAAEEDARGAELPKAPGLTSVASFEEPLNIPVPEVPNVSENSRVPGQTIESNAHRESQAKRNFSDLRLAKEVASLDRARLLASRGKAAEALGELDGFERSYGYMVLPSEATLVRIDVLVTMGQSSLAAQYARKLLATSLPASQRRRLEELARTRE